MMILFMAQCYTSEDINGAALIKNLAADLDKGGHPISVVPSISD
jgi:hypothetical protein